jgi:hypothetical protein
LKDDFAFRAATEFMDVPGNTPLNIGIAPPNSTSVDDTLKNFQVTLLPGGTYVAIANGVLDPSGFAANPDGRNIAFTLFAKDQIREAAAGSDVDFIVVHGATDAPAVDVIARNVTTLVDDAAYGDITDYISVPPASYTLDITPGNDNNTIVASFEADLSGLGGGAAIVLASGFLDPSKNPTNSEAFGLIAVLADGTVLLLPTAPVAIKKEQGIIPTQFNLSQNYPNPFNPNTIISFSVPQSDLVNLTVYNLLGQTVATLVNERLEPGNYKIDFNAQNLVSGAYFYVIEAGSFRSVKKMTLLK